MLDLCTSPHVSAAPLTGVHTVLLMLGKSDDALYYHAPLGEQVAHRAYIVGVHEGAQLLERLRLHGELSITARVTDNREFDAVLTLSHAANVRTIILTLCEERAFLQATPELMPQT